MKRAGSPGRSAALLALASALAACGGGPGEGPPIRVDVREGAPFAEVADSLAARGIIGNAFFFRVYARVTGDATRIRPGPYAFRRRAAWRSVLDDLVAGRILTARITFPEGFGIAEIAPRVVEFAGGNADSLLAILSDTATARRWNVPGPTMEGYLYPATYTLPVDATAEDIIASAVAAYHEVWTSERRARADSIGMSELEVTTLASIVEKEARIRDEMRRIAAVYRNRLRIGMPLQADPTVQYALGEHRERLLFRDIERVRDHPYNTYHRPGLPPGPIGAPSGQAIDAVLEPAVTDELFFVARGDGSHVFSRTLAEHNRAIAAIRRERAAERQRGNE
ncbi:MAG: endolytic transglycosylase MltG [Gemmatimonadetes bacterium]|nr:endolytic transglycosylase MltG [Gemmatimonadota bacterium]